MRTETPLPLIPPPPKKKKPLPPFATLAHNGRGHRNGQTERDRRAKKKKANLRVIPQLAAEVGRLLRPPAHHRKLHHVQDPPHVALEAALRLLVDVSGGGQHHRR